VCEKIKGDREREDSTIGAGIRDFFEDHFFFGGSEIVLTLLAKSAEQHNY
jgi:hypothetical protein